MNELSLLDSVFGDLLNGDYTSRNYVCVPRVDVKEEENTYTLEMELPGRSENDVSIELNHGNLTISSKEEEKKQDKKTKFLLKERKISEFSRRFTLPEDVDADSIHANFKNGVLTINMNKKEIAAPKKIMIEAF